MINEETKYTMHLGAVQVLLCAQTTKTKKENQKPQAAPIQE